MISGKPATPEPASEAPGREATEGSSDLDYNALCIDTNIFYETGYAFEKGLLGQLDQFAKSPIRVVISEIVEREMQGHLIEPIGEARALESGALHGIGNPHAQEFYLASGFKAVGVSATRFGEGIVYRRSLD